MCKFKEHLNFWRDKRKDREVTERWTEGWMERQTGQTGQTDH